jgi:hypothetical protein
MATNHNVKFDLFDTHAMAYKLLLMESGCDEKDESESISEHGVEARMDFYLNRSRSDGASTIMKQCLEEMKQRKDTKDENEISETDANTNSGDNMKRRMSFDSRRKPSVSSQTNDFTINRKEIEDEKKYDQPDISSQRPPLMYIPAVDSCEHLLTYERSAQSLDDRRRLFNEHRFVPYFTLPSPSFILHCLLDERLICLESYTSKNTQFKGTLLVKHSASLIGNEKNRKRIYVRKTMDEWKIYQDSEAHFMETSNERPSVDRYSFRLPFDSIRSGARMEFALAYEIYSDDGKMISYWDNNNQANYAFWYSG